MARPDLDGDAGSCAGVEAGFRVDGHAEGQRESLGVRPVCDRQQGHRFDAIDAATDRALHQSDGAQFHGKIG